NNCTTQTNGTVNEPPTSLSAVISSQTNVDCHGNANGTITAGVIGGTTPYQYSINGGATWQNGATFANLNGGSYTIDVKDSNNCTSQVSASVTQPPGPVVADAGTYQPICGDSMTLAAVLNNGFTGTWTLVSGTGTFADIHNPATSVCGISVGTN